MPHHSRPQHTPPSQPVEFPIPGPLLLDQSLAISERATKLYTAYAVWHERLLDGQLHILNPELVAEVDTTKSLIQVNRRYDRPTRTLADKDTLTIQTVPVVGGDHPSVAIVTKILKADTFDNVELEVKQYDLKADGSTSVSSVTTVAERTWGDHDLLDSSITPVHPATERDIISLATTYHSLVGLGLGQLAVRPRV